MNTNSISAAAIAPFPGYQNINQYQTTASSRYNSLQATFKRQMSKDLLLQAVYTYSRALDDASSLYSGPQDPYNLRAEWGLSDYDRTHVFVVNYIYDLPFFRQQRGFLGEAFGGWELSGILQFQSGTPVYVGLATSTNGLATRPDVVPGQSANGPKTLDHWFNTSAFEAPAFGFYGNAGRNIVRGPGIEDWDVSLFKTFRITERLDYQLRGDAFNVFNHPNFQGVSSNFGAGNFGQVYSAHDPRIIQVSMKLEF